MFSYCFNYMGHDLAGGKIEPRKVCINLYSLQRRSWKSRKKLKIRRELKRMPKKKKKLKSWILRKKKEGSNGKSFQKSKNFTGLKKILTKHSAFFGHKTQRSINWANNTWKNFKMQFQVVSSKFAWPVNLKADRNKLQSSKKQNQKDWTWVNFTPHSIKESWIYVICQPLEVNVHSKECLFNFHQNFLLTVLK